MAKKTKGKKNNSLSDALGISGEQVLESMRQEPEVAKAIGKLSKAVEADKINNDLMPDTIYFFEVKSSLGTVYMWKQFHGKCATLGQTPLLVTGNIFIQTGKRLASEKDYSRTICDHCGEQLNPRLAKELILERDARLLKRKRLAELKAKKRLELQKELVLLGGK